jgi:CubicO group peptidase (beta-lactamase class C family)
VPFTTAGLIAGRAGGSDWAGVMRKRIFEPLGMRSASCTAKEAEAAPEHSTPHTRLPGGEVRPVPWADIDNAGGAGCVNASARDMANWLRFQLADGTFDGKRLVAAGALRETRTPQMVVRQEGRWKVFFPESATTLLTYGLGWFVHDHRGRLAVSHGGTLDGFRAQTLLSPKDGCGVVVFANLAPSHFTEALSKSLLDHLLGLPKEDWNAFYRQQEEKQETEYNDRLKKRADDRKHDTKPSRELSAYAGGYEEPAYGRAEVKVDGDALALTWGRLTFRLEHHHYDTFTGTVVAPARDKVSYARSQFDVLFRLGSDGEVEGVRVLDQEFRRVKPTKK